MISTICGSYAIARTADQGLANLLGLSTLRHGTNPLSWLSIHTIGALPKLGGTRIGGDAAGSDYAHQNENRFYFSVDHNYFQFTEPREWKDKIANYPRCMPKLYATFSNVNLATYCTPFLGKSLAYKCFLTIPSSLIATITPTIKFRFPVEKVKKFEPDASLNGAACSTNNWQSPLNIGLLGTIYNGFSLGTLKQMKEYPSRVLTGVAQLALASIATYFMIQKFPAVLTTYRTSALTGALFAVC